MIEMGLLRDRRVELLDGWIVEREGIWQDCQEIYCDYLLNV